jgi:hypothetical protein
MNSEQEYINTQIKIIDNIENNLPKDVLYQLSCKINQSIVHAENTLINNRPSNMLNYIIKYGNNDIDMFDNLINKNNLNMGEYSLIAKDINDNSWYVRKTYSNQLQYYYLGNEDNYNLFLLFIKGYNKRYN